MATARDGSYFEIDGGTGPTVVLVHGLGLTNAMWDQQHAALTASFKVLRYDLMGHGRSPAPPARPNLSAFSDQLAVLLDETGTDRAAVIGFSLGGMIARRFGMDHPERLWALGILHSPHQRTVEERAAIQARVDQARHDGPTATVGAALDRWLGPDFHAAHPDMIARVGDMVRANDPAVYHTIYQILVDGVDELVAPDPVIDCPTLVMTGDKDYGNSPEMARAIAAEIPSAETVILPGLRHLAMIEDPAAFNAPLVSFLSRLDQIGTHEQCTP